MQHITYHDIVDQIPHLTHEEREKLLRMLMDSVGQSSGDQIEGIEAYVAVMLWRADQKAEACVFYRKAIQTDPAWRDDLTTIATQHLWSTEMIETANAIRTEIFHASVVTGNYSHLWVDPDRMGGQPCIQGTRIPVTTIARMMTAGMKEQEILEEFPQISPESLGDVRQYTRENPLLVNLT
jgi:uncharacterized protein (DUF433 family)